MKPHGAHGRHRSFDSVKGKRAARRADKQEVVEALGERDEDEREMAAEKLAETIEDEAFFEVEVFFEVEDDYCDDYGFPSTPEPPGDRWDEWDEWG